MRDARAARIDDKFRSRTFRSAGHAVAASKRI
jgi:hypothetical protein